MSYVQLKKETWRLASDRNELVDAVVARRVRLNLRPFGGGSDAFFVDRQDQIGFVCRSKSRGFKGGAVVSVIITYESGGDQGDFFTLDHCEVSR
ncbi:hypothetical protein NU688_32370 [Variovorax sp. ZS18.2.2]|nr:hypothetical protein [Variovorax sp. ZS18.2.2]